jgi:ATP adenylyltransferase
MDHLWSPWRLDYVAGNKPDTGCPFCLPTKAGSDEPASLERESLVVWRGAHTFIILNLYPYNNGHLLITPYRHVATLAALSSDELQEMASLVQRAEIALTEAYRPQGINVGINLGKTAGAGILEHIHMHVVPRWHGDTNFMTVVGDMRVLPESLAATAERLRPIFGRLK